MTNVWALDRIEELVDQRNRCQALLRWLFEVQKDPPKGVSEEEWERKRQEIEAALAAQ